MTAPTLFATPDPKEWRALVEASPVATAFQTPEMADFLRRQGTAHIAAVGERGRLAGVAVTQVQGWGPTRRAIIVGGPLLADDISDDALRLLLTEVRRQHWRCTYIETRNLADYSKWHSCLEAEGFAYQPHYNIWIDTHDPEALLPRMASDRRKNLRQAMRHGATVTASPSAEQFDRFYAILFDTYRQRAHKPLPPKEFFEALLHEPFTRLFAVLAPDGEVIGGQLCAALDNRVLYAWYCCGLDHQYRDLSPSAMANSAAMQYAADHGMRRLDMMGAGSPDDGGYGVRDFKLRFGGELVEHGRFLCVNRRLTYRLGNRAMQLLKRL